MTTPSQGDNEPMKHLLPLILVCLLLCGCTTGTVPEETAASEPQAAAPSEPIRTYLETRGTLKVFTPRIAYAYAMLPMDDGLLVLSGADEKTLTLLSGDGLYITASAAIPADSTSVRKGSGFLSYYDPTARQTVVLGSDLREISRIDAPTAMVGTPVLSEDRTALYYCTADSVRVWELDSGIHRLVREVSGLSVSGLHFGDTVLECRRENGTLLLSTQTGQTLWDGSEPNLITAGNRYYASLSPEALLFGTVGADPTALTPGDLTARCSFLPQSHAAVTAADDGTLDYYDLDTGRRTARLSLDTNPIALADDGSGGVYILVREDPHSYPILLYWDTALSAVTDDAVYTGPYYTKEDPDYDGLAALQVKANTLSESCGIPVLIWEAAAGLEAGEYTPETEYLVPITKQALERLEACLSIFPEGFLEATAAPFSSVQIGLVRSIGDGLTAAQFLRERDASILLTPGFTEAALYDKLYVLMDTKILNDSIAYDQWSKLNPSGFAYTGSGSPDEASPYLQQATRYFMDAASMTYPTADRAAIFARAMTAGNEAYFSSSPMQYKLRAICEGIREAYGLEKSAETYPWEQYLVWSLAYTK